MNCFTTNPPLSIVHYAGPPKSKPASQRKSQPPSTLTRTIEHLHRSPAREDAELPSPVAARVTTPSLEAIGPVFRSCNVTTNDVVGLSLLPHVSESPKPSISRATGYSFGNPIVCGDDSDDADISSDESLPSLAIITRLFSANIKDREPVVSVVVDSAEAKNAGLDPLSKPDSKSKLNQDSSEPTTPCRDTVISEADEMRKSIDNQAPRYMSTGLDGHHDIHATLAEDPTVIADIEEKQTVSRTDRACAQLALQEVKGTKRARARADDSHNQSTIKLLKYQGQSSPSLDDDGTLPDGEQTGSSALIRKHPKRVCPSFNIEISKSSAIRRPATKFNSKAVQADIVWNPKDPQGLWEVERILDSRACGGKVWYLVKWKGFSGNANTWEPARHLKTAQDAKKAYMKDASRAKRSAILAAAALRATKPCRC